MSAKAWVLTLGVTIHFIAALAFLLCGVGLYGPLFRTAGADLALGIGLSVSLVAALRGLDGYVKRHR